MEGCPEGREAVPDSQEQPDRQEMAEVAQRFAALEDIPPFTYLKNPDYVIIYANRAYRETFGDPLGRKCFEVIHGRTEPCRNCPSLKVLETKQPHVFEWSHPESGRVYHVSNHLYSEVDGTSLIMTLGVDVTDQKIIQEAFQQSEARYRLLVNQLPALVFKGYPDWSVDFFDRKIEALTGYAKEDFDSRRLKWCDLIPAEDLEYAARVFVEALKTDKSYVREHRIKTKGGETRWVQCRGRIFCDEQGKVDYISGVTFDITQAKQVEEALRESEQEYKALVNTVPAVVYKGYADWTIDFFDNKIEALTGYPKEAFDSRELTWKDLILPEEFEGARQAFIKALKDDKTYVREYRIRHRDGHSVWIQARGQIFCDPRGQIIHVSGVLFDITERKRAEDNLRKSEQNLRYFASKILNAQEMERKRVSRELHDDLGQGLLFLKLQLKTLEKNLAQGAALAPEDWQELLSSVNNMVEDVRRLSRDLSPAILEDLGLTAGLRRLAEEFNRLYTLGYCRASLDDIDDLFDPSQRILVFRIFQECLTNIAKHSRASQVTALVERKRNKVAFVIEDNGLGFDISQAGVREDSSQGLGLAAIEERVRMLGGLLQLRSGKGAGTRIAFTVPMRTRKSEISPV